MARSWFARLRWVALAAFCISMIAALIFALFLQPTRAAAAGQTIAPPLTGQPHIAGPHNTYNDALVAKKLARLHKKVPATISADYISGTGWPVVFVHGFNSGASIDCQNSYWGTATSFLKSQGWSGALTTVGYYSGDKNCNVALSNYASHCTTAYAGHQGTTNEDLRHVSCELAWYIWENYTQYGQNVQLVGHSMGGLIIRWALYDTPIDIALPPYIDVEDAVTMATPHGGIPVAGAALFLCGECWQGQEMRTNNSFWQTLNNNGQNPQGAGPGTDWSMMGSSCESFYNVFDPGVSWQSSLDMDGGHKTEYLNPPCYDHGAYLQDTSTTQNAHANWCDFCARDVVSFSSTSWPHSLQNMLLALASNYW